ncbi:MAG: isochorismatase family cysteine hydrolase [Pseudomonadota bacterium]
MKTLPSDHSSQERERRIVPAETVCLSIDMQNAEWSPEQMARAQDPTAPEAKNLEFLERLQEIVIPNQQRLQSAARAAGVEVVYTTIEALTRDGRDIGLDHKISGLFFPKGAWEAGVIEAVGPVGDEIVIPKTASGIFNCTNIEYVLRNLGARQIILYGVSTDQCVETAVRDAADRGFLVTVVEDCCAAMEAPRHTRAIDAIDGHYARVRSTDEMIAELAEAR